MAASAEVVRAPGVKCILKIVKMKSKIDQKVSKGTILCLYKTDEDDTLHKLKSSTTGTVKEVFVKEGEECLAGHHILSIERVKCSHPVVMKDMCADCGADLRIENSTAGNRKEDVSASVAMVHSIPELIVSEEQAKELGKADEERLLKTRKLVLLVDLDQTLIHTTNDNIPANLKDVHHFQLWHGNQLLWYHTHLRPGTEQFLENISKLFELHICTFGVRMYAHTIAKILDPEGKYFSHRILSRDECFNATSKTANLKALFPCGDGMVCIIDDREDVWNHVPNLIHVKPYRFFQGTADINAPPGLSKTEEDDKPMIHRVRRVSQSSVDTQKDQTKETEGDVRNNADKSGSGDVEMTEKASEKTIKAEVNENDIKTETESDRAGGDAVIGTTGSDMEKQSFAKTEQMDADRVERHETESVNELVAEQKVIDKDGSGDTTTETSPKEPDKTDDNIEVKENSYDGENTVKDGKVSDGDKSVKDDVSEQEEEWIEWDDEDDYLFYLEETLKKIHSAFFSLNDQFKERGDSENLAVNEKPSLKNIIPYIKRKVLKGCNIVFSGVIPTNMDAEKSKAYTVAKALGANVQQNVVPRKIDPEKATTHVVAAKLGTSKVRSAQKCKDIQIVTVDWLWSCAERWEKEEESLFLLTKDANDVPESDCPNIEKMQKNSRDPRKRKKDSNDDSERKDKRQKQNSDNSEYNSESNFISEMEVEDMPDVQDKVTSEDSLEDNAFSSTSQVNFKEEPFGLAKEPKEKKFSLSYNPIYAFSDDDLAYMDKEVDDIMDEDDDPSSEEDEAREARLRQAVLKSGDREGESSSEESLSGETPRGWGLKRMLSPKSSSSEEDICSKVSLQQTEDQESDSENVMKRYNDIMTAFAPETESDEYEESIGSVDDEIADAVEKEFLS